MILFIPRLSKTFDPVHNIENEHLKMLRIELNKKYTEKELDGYSLYL